MEDLNPHRLDFTIERPAMAFLKKHLLTAALLLSTWFGPSAFGDTLTYQTIIGSDTTPTVFTLSQLKNGKKAKAEYHTGGVVAFSEVIMTDSFSTQNWRYICRQNKSDLTGWLVNNAVVIEGSFKNKKVYKTFPQKDIDWKQMFPFDLRNFVRSDSTRTSFCGVSTIEMASMQLGTLEVTKIGTEHVMVRNKNLELLHLHVAPPGLLSVFWHGDYWFAPNSGTLVKSISYDYPGAPPVISILTN